MIREPHVLAKLRVGLETLDEAILLVHPELCDDSNVTSPFLGYVDLCLQAVLLVQGLQVPRLGAANLVEGDGVAHYVPDLKAFDLHVRQESVLAKELVSHLAGDEAIPLLWEEGDD